MIFAYNATKISPQTTRENGKRKNKLTTKSTLKETSNWENRNEQESETTSIAKEHIGEFPFDSGELSLLYLCGAEFPT